jgi:hypothetical protein
MGKYTTVSTYVEVDVDLSEFDTDDLIDELESRGEIVGGESGQAHPLLTAIWQKRRLGQDYQHDLDALIYDVLGKVI